MIRQDSIDISRIDKKTMGRKTTLNSVGESEYEQDIKLIDQIA